MVCWHRNVVWTIPIAGTVRGFILLTMMLVRFLSRSTIVANWLNIRPRLGDRSVLTILLGLLLDSIVSIVFVRWLNSLLASTLDRFTHLRTPLNRHLASYGVVVNRT